MATTVLVITYNSAHLLKNLEYVLANSTKCIDEILFIDNASNDNTIHNLKQFHLSGISKRIIENNENIGYRRALNQGVANSKNEYIVSLNLDIIFEQGDICNLVSRLKDNENISCVLPKTYQSGNPLPYFVSKESIPFLYVHNIPSPGRLTSNFSMPTEVCGGPVFAFKKSSYLLSGNLDENVFMYNEEAEMSIRMRGCGFIFLVTDKVIVKHTWGGSGLYERDDGEKSDFFIQNWLKSSVYLYKKMFSSDSLPRKSLWAIIYLIRALEFTVLKRRFEYLKLASHYLLLNTDFSSKHLYSTNWRIRLFLRGHLREIMNRLIQK